MLAFEFSLHINREVSWCSNLGSVSQVLVVGFVILKKIDIMTKKKNTAVLIAENN